MAMVDTLHQRGIGVILDWVPVALPDRRARPRLLRRHAPVRARRSAPRLPPRLDQLHLQLRPPRGAQLPDLVGAVLARPLPHRRPARRRRRVDAVPRLLAQGGRVDPERGRRPREPRRDRASCSSFNDAVYTRVSRRRRRSPRSRRRGRWCRGRTRSAASASATSGTSAGCTTRSSTSSASRSTASTTTTSSRSARSTRTARTSCCRCRTTRSCTARARCSRRCRATRGRSSRTCGCSSATSGRSRARSCCSWAARSAQWGEWNHDGELDWHARSSIRAHAGHRSAGSAISTALYREQPALHELRLRAGGLRVDRRRRRATTASLAFLRAGERPAIRRSSSVVRTSRRCRATATASACRAAGTGARSLNTDADDLRRQRASATAAASMRRDGPRATAARTVARRSRCRRSASSSSCRRRRARCESRSPDLSTDRRRRPVAATQE